MSYALVRQAIIEKKAIHATYSGVYNHSTVFGQNSMPGRPPYLRVTVHRSQVCRPSAATCGGRDLGCPAF